MTAAIAIATYEVVLDGVVVSTGHPTVESAVLIGISLGAGLPDDAYDTLYAAGAGGSCRGTDGTVSVRGSSAPPSSVRPARSPRWWGESYGGKTDAALEALTSAGLGLVESDFAAIAVACADQAGLDVEGQAQLRSMLDQVLAAAAARTKLAEDTFARIDAAYADEDTGARRRDTARSAPTASPRRRVFGGVA